MPSCPSDEDDIERHAIQQQEFEPLDLHRPPIPERALSGERDDFALASKLVNDARQNLLERTSSPPARPSAGATRFADLDRRLGSNSGGKP